MKIITPQMIGEDQLTASNVPENDAPEWDMATTYALGNRVMYEHRIYESLANMNTGNQPDLFPLQWLNTGATNRYRMFDGVIGAGTSNPMTVDVSVKTGQVINAVSLFGLSGSRLDVTLTDQFEGLVYERTMPLQDNSLITNWYAYFFEPVVARHDVTLLDLPSYGSATLRVVVDAGEQTAVVGEMVIGRSQTLGVSLFGTSVGIQDYSRKERDQFGNIQVVERRFTKLVDYDVSIETGRVSAAQQILAAFRAKPAVYVGSELHPETVVYGFYRSFNIVISGPTQSDATIEVEGLT
jgi:hypothetical protein